MNREAKAWRAVAVTITAVVFMAAATTIGTMPGGGASGYVLTKSSANDFDVTWAAPSSSALPAGAIIMWSGTIANIPSGYVICDGNNGTPNLLASFVKGVATAATDPGATGGAATHTPTGTVTAPTVSWPAGVPTAANESAHTHTYTDVPNHVHVQSVNSGTTGGTSGYTPDTSTSTSTSSGYSTANPTGGVATGTTAAGSAHTHTISWPAGVPTNSTPTFTGSSANTEPAYYAIAFIMKT